MTVQTNLERAVREWLTDAPDQLPDPYLDAALDEISTTPQRRAGWLARRFPPMTNSTLRVGVAAVAVAALALLGARYLLPSSYFGLGTSPEPTPTPIALEATDIDRPVAGGRYGVGAPFSLPFSLDLPALWVPHAITEGESSFSGPSTDSYPYIGVFTVDAVYRDPCHPELGTQPSDQPMGFDELTANMGRLEGFESTPVSIETIGGRSVSHFTLTNSVDTETAGCTDGQLLPLFDATGGVPVSTNGGTEQEVWVIDVGPRPLLVVGETGDGDVDARQREIEAIVASIGL